MTLKEVYEAMLIELNKNFGSTDLLLEDFNYFVNKGILQYVQKRYNVSETNRQVLDDLKNIIVPGELSKAELTSTKNKGWYFFKGELPDDYLHLMSCDVEFVVRADFECFKENHVEVVEVFPLTTSVEKKARSNFWFKPSFKKPYYRVTGDRSTYDTSTPKGILSKLEVTFGDSPYLLDEHNQLIIPDAKVELEKVYYEYLKVPDKMTLTYEELDEISDSSQLMEFSEDVCGEIIKETIKLVALKTGNPLIQNYDQINMSVPPHGGLQQQ